MATYYVHPMGNDDNPGTEQEPWRTVNRAATTAAAGDSVIFEDGDYTIHGGQSRWNSGAAGSPITFKARSPRAVAWVQSADGRHLVGMDGQKYLVFEGIVVRGDQAFELSDHIRIQNCDNVTLDDCEICDGHGHGIRIRGGSRSITIRKCAVHTENTDYPCDGIHIVGDGNKDIVIHETEVYHIEHAGIDVNLVDGLVISNCHVHDVGSHGISIGDSDSTGDTLANIAIRDNFVHDCDTGYGASPSSYHNGIRIHRNAINVEIYRNDVYANETSGLLVRSSAIGPINIWNNTFYDNTRNPARASRGSVRCDHDPGEHNSPTVRFKNNIIYVTQAARTYYFPAEVEDCLDIDCNLLYSDSGTTEIRRNDRTYNRYSAYKSAGFEPSTVVDADPDMTDPVNASFTLGKSSPAIDAGVDIGLPYQGAAPDIGAHEYRKGCLPFSHSRVFRLRNGGLT